METDLATVRRPARDWAREYAELSAADADLGPEDLERFAVAAHVLGDDEQAVKLLDRAHRGYLEQGRPDKAVRCVWWLIFHLRNAGQTSRAAGWIARLRRILDDDDPDGQLSYLTLLGEGVSLMQAGAVDEALPMVDRAAAGARAAETMISSCWLASLADVALMSKDTRQNRSRLWTRSWSTSSPIAWRPKLSDWPTAR